MLVAKLVPSGQVVGFLNAERMLFDYLYVDSLAVSEQYRRGGIGKKLMNKILEMGKLQHQHRIWLLAVADNEKSNKFYKSLGYKSKF